jgi:hypothetical protein
VEDPKNYVYAILETRKVQIRVRSLAGEGYKVEVDTDAQKEVAEARIKGYDKVHVLENVC